MHQTFVGASATVVIIIVSSAVVILLLALLLTLYFKRKIKHAEASNAAPVHIYDVINAPRQTPPSLERPPLIEPPFQAQNPLQAQRNIALVGKDGNTAEPNINLTGNIAYSNRTAKNLAWQNTDNVTYDNGEELPGEYEEMQNSYGEINVTYVNVEELSGEL